MTFKLDGENPPGVLSEVKTCRCAPLSQCSDGISMIIATTLFVYQVDYNKLILNQVQMIIYYLGFVIICTIGFMCVCIYYSVQIHFIFFIQYSLIFLFYPLLGHDFLHVYKIIS